MPGWLLDEWGFPASFIFGLLAASVSMVLVMAINEKAKPEAPTALRLGRVCDSSEDQPTEFGSQKV